MSKEWGPPQRLKDPMKYLAVAKQEVRSFDSIFSKPSVQPKAEPNHQWPKRVMAQQPPKPARNIPAASGIRNLGVKKRLESGFRCGNRCLNIAAAVVAVQ